MKLLALFISLIICPLAFSQKAKLKCTDDTKVVSSCPLKSSSIKDAATEIVKSCKESEKNELTILQAKAVANLGLANGGPKTIAEFEAQIANKKSSIAEYNLEIKKLKDTIEHFNERRASFLKKYNSLLQEKKHLESKLEDSHKVSSKKDEKLGEKYYAVIDKLSELEYSPHFAAQKKSYFQDTLKNSQGELKELEIDLATNISDLNDLKKAPEDGRDNLILKRVKNELQKSTKGVKQNEKYTDCGFTDLEIVAINHYSGIGYREINKALRNPETPPSADLQVIIDAINSGLEKIANTSELVKRGANLPPDLLAQHCMGCLVTYPSFTSSSLAEGFGSSQKYIIQSKHGKYIAPLSSHSGEEEVLFKTNTQFKVLNIEGTNYSLEEVD